MECVVRPVAESDRERWLSMRYQLWPDGRRAEHAEEIARYFAQDWPFERSEVLVAERSDGRLVGFAELSIRPYAEGCLPRVAYLEGWFVEAEARRSGVGAALIGAAEDWGRQLGCREFASDAEPENRASIEAHLRLGFEDAGLVRCFKKIL